MFGDACTHVPSTLVQCSIEGKLPAPHACRTEEAAVTHVVALTHNLYVFQQNAQY